jgi:hypothetical protein
MTVTVEVLKPCKATRDMTGITPHITPSAHVCAPSRNMRETAHYGALFIVTILIIVTL